MSNYRNRRTNDPQIVIPAWVKDAEHGEIITATLDLRRIPSQIDGSPLDEIVLIVPIPNEDSNRTKVYVKLKSRRAIQEQANQGRPMGLPHFQQDTERFSTAPRPLDQGHDQVYEEEEPQSQR